MYETEMTIKVKSRSLGNLRRLTSTMERLMTFIACESYSIDVKDPGVERYDPRGSDGPPVTLTRDRITGETVRTVPFERYEEPAFMRQGRYPWASGSQTEKKPVARVEARFLNYETWVFYYKDKEIITYHQPNEETKRAVTSLVAGLNATDIG